MTVPVGVLDGRAVPLQGVNTGTIIIAVGGSSGKLIWNANGLQTLFGTAPAATALVPDRIVDGTRELSVALPIPSFRMQLLFDGTSGTTTYEVWRRRGGVNTLMATLSIAAASGNYSSVTAAAADPVFLLGDELYVQPVAVGTNAFGASIEAVL